MIRILHVVDGMSIGGGIQAFIMNIYRNIDRDKVQFDFLLHRHNETSYESEIQSLGGKIFYTPGRKQGILTNKKGLNDFFREHQEYKVVHFHASSLSYIEPLIAAKRAGIPTRIIHSHSSRIIGRNRVIHSINHYLNKKRISNIATDYLACGELAGKWMFSDTPAEKQMIVIKNGIDLEKYKFSEKTRRLVREEFGLNNDFVICHMGRFEAVKNHTFLLNIFQNLLTKNANARLFLLGNGTMMDDMQELARSLQIEDKVIFLGVRSDPFRYLQAGDVFVLPSLYEGFPVSVIEAQATGMPVVMSDSITSDAAINSNVIQLSLNKPAEVWADVILRTPDRVMSNQKLYDEGLDIVSSINQLLEIYFR